MGQDNSSDEEDEDDEDEDQNNSNGQPIQQSEAANEGASEGGRTATQP